MDLASQALDVTPWRPEEYERSRAALRGAMAESGSVPQAAQIPEVITMRGKRASVMGSRRRRSMDTKGKIGIGAGIGAIAAAAAAILVVTSPPQPATSTSQASVPTGTASPVSTANSPLMTLAANIKANDKGPLPGNASLVIQTQAASGPGQPDGVVYALYADSGIMYTGDDKQTLISGMSQPLDPRNSETYRWAVAAREAASGNLAAARVRMINTFPNCFGLGQSPAAQKEIKAKCWAAGAAERRAKMGDKAPTEEPADYEGQSEVDNTLWVACNNALSWAGSDPRIREGVLRLLSTLPEVTVVNSNTKGEPTLTITGGPGLFNDGNYHEVDVIDAKTGMPVSSAGVEGGTAVATDYFTFSRVTLADIKAGKF
jgi:hypothetical protein